MSSAINKFSITNAAFDLGGGFKPTEGFGVVVPVGEPAGDRSLRAAHAVKAAAADGLAGDQGEPALDLAVP